MKGLKRLAVLGLAVFVGMMYFVSNVCADEGVAGGKEVKIAGAEARKPVMAPSGPAKMRVETKAQRAKRLFNEGKLDEAQAIFEELEAADPTDLDAKRFVKAIIVEKRRLAERDQWNTQKDMILDVRRSWVPPEYAKEEYSATSVFEGRRMKSERQILMEEKANQVIPEINFTDAQLSDVLKYLSNVSGINIIFDEDLIKGGGVAALSEDTEEVGVGEEKRVEEAAGGSTGKSPLSGRVTISLKNVPLIEALKYILSAKGLKYRIDEYAILVSTPSRLENVEMETRYYHLSSGSGVFTSMGKKDVTEEGEEAVVSRSSQGETSMTIKDVLEQSGVPFPPGSKIFLDQRTGTLIVRNTPANLQIVEKILGALDVPPFQVAIEAKFVEVEEGVMQELGLEAYLNSNFNLGYKYNSGPGPFTGPAQPSAAIMQGTGINSSAGAPGSNAQFTKGLRFLQNGAAGSFGDAFFNASGAGIFSIATLSQPQLQFVLHALDQCGVANTLSAPKVTTVNNQQAKIEVVTEVIYPSEFEITPPTTNNSGLVITPAVVIPSAFTTRDTGIILEVTPSVGADRKTINLTLIPEVSALESWMDYGIPAGTGGSTFNKVPVLQPFFNTRNVTTSVIINDGETVVLGGLVRDTTTRYNDKVPVLGDLPVIGRAFRVEGEVSSKRNLLIFVSAHLLTPNGDKIKGPKIKKTKIFNP